MAQPHPLASAVQPGLLGHDGLLRLARLMRLNEQRAILQNKAASSLAREQQLVQSRAAFHAVVQLLERGTAAAASCREGKARWASSDWATATKAGQAGEAAVGIVVDYIHAGVNFGLQIVPNYELRTECAAWVAEHASWLLRELAGAAPGDAARAAQLAAEAAMQRDSVLEAMRAMQRRAVSKAFVRGWKRQGLRLEGLLGR